MRVKSPLYFLLLFLLIAFVPGCEENQTGEGTDPTASKQKSDAAYKMMEDDMYMMINGNFQNASDFDQLRWKQMNATFREAITLDPNNYTAKYGAALSEIFAVYSDTMVNNLIKQFESAMNGENTGMNNSPVLGSLKKSLIPANTQQMRIPTENIAAALFSVQKLALVDPPLLSRVQAAIREKLLPAMEYAKARLAECESNPNFTFTVTGRMQGDNNFDIVTIYVTEVYFTDALLNMMASVLESTLIYKFDLADYNQATIVAALQPSSTNFFYMNDDGQTRAQNVKNDFLGALNKMKQGISSLETFSGRRPDAVVKIGNSGDRTIKQQDIDTVKKYLDKVINAFNTEQTIDIIDGDSDGNDYTVRVNLANFFANMPQNPKTAFLPAYTVEASGTDDIKFKFNAQTYADFTFPDPTMAGLFPGMTNETLKRLLRIDEEFAFRFAFNALKFGAQDPWWSSNGLNVTVRLTTQSNKVYTKSFSIDPYEDTEWFIKDVTNTPDMITRAELNYGNGYVDYTSLDTNLRVYVQSKSDFYCQFHIYTAPVLTGIQAFTNSIQVNWTVEGQQSGYSYFIMERKAGSGNFEDQQSFGGWMSYSYNDWNNIAPGINYTYRLRCQAWSWGNTLVPYNTVYSNTLSITP